MTILLYLLFHNFAHYLVDSTKSVGVQPIYGYGSKVLAGFSTAQGLRDTFFVQDPLCDIQEVRQSTQCCI